MKTEKEVLIENFQALTEDLLDHYEEYTEEEKAQIKEIAELKMPDLNAASIESAMSMIAGAARSMGVEVVD